MRRWASRYQRELSVAATYVALLVVMGIRNPDFFKAEQLRSFIVSRAPVLVAAVGMTLVIVARQIDISIASQFSVCGVVAALLAREGAPMPLVVLGALITGAMLGSVNGLLVAGLRLPSIVVTLAMLSILRGTLQWAREGVAVRDLPPYFQWFGLGQSTGQWVVVLIALAVFCLFAWGMRQLAVGRAVYATGSDAEAARLAGIRPRLVVFGVFVTMGALAGLSALLASVQLVLIYPKDGEGLEIQAIAAVVVGGTAVSGGRGTLVGSLIGVLLLGSIGPALTFLGIQPQWERAIQGLVILLAVASDRLGRGGH
jgi:rhamnose transport system permease protein